MKGIVDAHSVQDGFRALVALNHRYDQRTTATLLQASLDVVGPPILKGVQEVLVGVPKWEAKMASLLNRHGEKLSDQMKLAVFINMLPKEYQDVGMQMSCGRKLTYTELRDHILGMANQKAQLNRPVPMDTNCIDVKPGDEGPNWDEGSWDEGWGVDAVSMNTLCYACWGYGHFARDCPLGNKGKGEKGDKGKGKGKTGFYGKGDKGKGKGKSGFKGKGDKGKGKGKGDGWGPYSYGKGYQGYCHACGEQGHKAYEGMCKVQQVSVEGNQNAAADCDAVVIDTVWRLCQVESEGIAAEAQPTPRESIGHQRYSLGKSSGKGIRLSNKGIAAEAQPTPRESIGHQRYSLGKYSGKGIRLSNKFEEFTEDDEEEDEDKEADEGEVVGFTGHILEGPKMEKRGVSLNVGWGSVPHRIAPADEDMVAAPPGLILGESMREKGRTLSPGQSPIAAEHSCSGICCSEGFQNAGMLRRKQKRQWRKMTDVDVDFDVCPVEKGDKKMMCLDFQVADVKKPLIAVKRITEKGNHVTFGPNLEDNYIWNKASGDKMMLKPQGKGSYVMDVEFVGGEKTVITVDSGAEESVCPWEWGEKLFGTTAAESWMTFKNASGGNIPHWGKREIKVVSPF